MATIQYTKTAMKSLRRIPQNIANNFIASLNKIVEGNSEGLDVRKLAATEGYRLRIGGHRAIYTWKDEKLTLLVLRVGPRGDIYK